MGITNARLKANQENARKSTGPKTIAGKNQVRQNATRHGLLSQGLFFENEQDRASYEAMLKEVAACWQPADFMEWALVENLALDFWKEQVANRWELRELAKRESPRTPEMLGSLMQGEASEVMLPGVERPHSAGGPVGELLWECDELFIRVGSGSSQDGSPAEAEPHRATGKTGRRQFQVEARLSDRLDKLTRYATAIRRDRDRSIQQLRNLKERWRPAGA